MYVLGNIELLPDVQILRSKFSSRRYVKTSDCNTFLSYQSFHIISYYKNYGCLESAEFPDSRMIFYLFLTLLWTFWQDITIVSGRCKNFVCMSLRSDLLSPAVWLMFWFFLSNFESLFSVTENSRFCLRIKFACSTYWGDWLIISVSIF